MANITQRGNTFRIRVFVGTDMNGKKLMKSKTFTPPAGVTPKKAEKLAQEYAFEFEKHCRGFTELNENMRFSELADWYFTNYAPVELKESTVFTYKGQYRNHIEPILGNMKIKDITPPKLTQVMQSYDLNPAIRTIGMGKALANILLEQKSYIDDLKLTLGENFAHPEMVFVSALGNYRDRNSVYQSLKRFTKDTEFENMTLHQLRHCNATILLNSGFDLKVVSEHLGHCDIGVTADIYAEVLRSMKAKTAEQIELKLK
ncbi:MAG: site-specific integrase [Oscillospiraceae bacterium]|nr:site-specific integrase [Oscillospiraceae bacterium]